MATKFKLLIGVDFSEHSPKTVKGAANFADEARASLEILYVSKDKDFFAHDNKDIIQDKLEELKNNLIESGISVEETNIRCGEVSEEIIKVSEDMDCDLIVVGCGNKAQGQTYNVCKNALKILNQTDIPVMVIKKSTPSVFKKIVCPVDLSKRSKKVLDYSIKIAKLLKSELIVLHAIDSALSSNSVPIEKSEEDKYLQFPKDKINLFKMFLRDFDFEGVDWKEEVLQGHPAQTIIDYTALNEISLIIMGTHSRDFADDFFVGSIADTVLKNTDCQSILLQ